MPFFDLIKSDGPSRQILGQNLMTWPIGFWNTILFLGSCNIGQHKKTDPFLRSKSKNVKLGIGLQKTQPHGAVFLDGAMQFSGVLPNRTAPYGFAFNKVAPNRTVGLSKLKIRVASHRTILKNQIRTEPRSGLRIFKTKYFATVLWGYWCFLSDHTAPHDFPSDKTAPNRNIGFSKPKIRTDHTHRMILQK